MEQAPQTNSEGSITPRDAASAGADGRERAVDGVGTKVPKAAGGTADRTMTPAGNLLPIGELTGRRARLGCSFEERLSGDGTAAVWADAEVDAGEAPK